MKHIWAYSPVKWKGKKWKDKKWMLTGRPEYGVWYGGEDLELNVVVMEAKKHHSGGAGVPRALAYMGKYLTRSSSQCTIRLTCQKGALISSTKMLARQNLLSTVWCLHRCYKSHAFSILGGILFQTPNAAIKFCVVISRDRSATRQNFPKFGKTRRSALSTFGPTLHGDTQTLTTKPSLC